MPSYPVRLALDNYRTNYDNPYLRHKTTERGTYDRCRARHGATLHPSSDPTDPPFDVILVNAAGEVTETSISNIAFRFSGDASAPYITPRSSCGLLEGVQRAELLEKGEIVEGVVTVQQLKEAVRADSVEIICFNGVRGVFKAYVSKLGLPEPTVPRFSLVSTGSNSHGQLAVGDMDDRHHFASVSRPIADCPPRHLASGANHALYIYGDDQDGVIFVSGSNRRRQTYPGDLLPGVVFRQLDVKWLLPSPVVEDYVPVGVAACWETSFVQFRPRVGRGDDLIISFGANDWGERGSVGAEAGPTPVDFSALRSVDTVLRIEQVEAGPRHVLALVSFLPAIPSDSSSSSPAPRVLVGWGAARHGQLGPLSSSAPPPKVVPTPQPVLLPPGYSGADVVDFAVGKDHSAVLLRARDGEEQKVLLLGSGKHGQLGPLDEQRMVYPATPSDDADAAPAPTRTASQRQPRPPQPSSNLLALRTLLDLPNLSSSASSIAAVGCSWNSTFLSLSRNDSSSSTLGPDQHPSPAHQLVAFGLNSHGQLGASSALPPAIAPSSSPATALPAVPPSLGQPHLVDLPTLPSLPSLPLSPSSSSSLTDSPPTYSRQLVKLACGSEHVLAHLRFSRSPSSRSALGGNSARASSSAPDEYDEVWGWGWNEHGNLGLGVMAGEAKDGGEGENGAAGLDDVFLPRRIWPPADGGEVSGVEGGRKRVVDIWAGMATSWILLEAIEA
ncbi:hypothetical protein JCM10207_007652 [Rhodosporidiobolus poonsookiae]